MAKPVKVAQLNRYIKQILTSDPILTNVSVIGEISNIKYHSTGHVYFTLKDETSKVSCFLPADVLRHIRYELEDGMEIIAIGYVSIFERGGTYSLNIKDIELTGIGNLAAAFERLKAKLAAEGLFDSDKKKTIPKFPETVGIITAPTGAAIKDILSTIKRRWPITKTILFPSLVQGASAAPEIVKQIKKAQEFDLDVLIVGRGGGSIEDMWCFNDEEVARALYECSIPVISAVGHEIDFTIADYVADLRAPTPTGAAEMAVPNQTDFYNYLNQVNLRLNKSMSNYIKNNRERLDNLKNSYILKNPISIYQIKEQKFDTLFEKLNLVMNSLLVNERRNLDIKIDKLESIIERYLDNSKNRYLTFLNKLEVLNPVLTIKRGYSVTKINDTVISSIKKVKTNDTVTIDLTDGSLVSTVKEIIKN